MSSSMYQCKIRLRQDVRRRIDHAAQQRGVTLTEEMRDRLERSFDRDPLPGIAANVKRLVTLLAGEDA